MTNNISADDPTAHDAVRQSHDDRDEDRPPRARVHLLAADGLLTEAGVHPPREYFTLCGRVITDSDLPHIACPDECDCELRYCPTCIQRAIGWNAEIENGMRAPGWTARVGCDGEIDAPAGGDRATGSSSALGGAPAAQRP